MKTGPENNFSSDNCGLPDWGRDALENRCCVFIRLADLRGEAWLRSQKLYLQPEDLYPQAGDIHL